MRPTSGINFMIFPPLIATCGGRIDFCGRHVLSSDSSCRLGFGSARLDGHLRWPIFLYSYELKRSD